jgi:hypothetical protein
MDDSVKNRAETLFDQALSGSGNRDPRDFYRKRLKELKGTDPSAFATAATYYRDELIPGIADGRLEPLSAWLEYGRFLAELIEEGTTVLIDESGKSRAYEPGSGAGLLILHLPRDSKRRALLIGLPTQLSPAQRASYQLLVEGRQRAPTTAQVSPGP